MGKHWSDEEIAVLKEKFPELGMTELLVAGLLDRSQSQVEYKARQLGLKQQCPDCGVEISPRGIRCTCCALRASHACGKRAGNSDAMKAAHARGCFDNDDYRLKQSEAMKAVWARGDFDMVAEVTRARWSRGDMDFLYDKEVVARRANGIKAAWERGAYGSAETRRKRSENMRAAWEQGAFDGIFESPTKPEQAVMAVLEFMGIDYAFNTLRLGSYTYDFHLPQYDILVEYDGWYWHHRPGAAERDKIKSILAAEADYRLIRLKGKRREDLTGAEIWSQLSRALER